MRIADQLPDVKIRQVGGWKVGAGISMGQERSGEGISQSGSRMLHSSDPQSAHAVSHDPYATEANASPHHATNIGRVTLTVVEGPCAGASKEYTSHCTEFIGRSAQASWRLLEDASISRHHLRLEMNPPECFLVDVGSSLGTFVNYERVTESHLKDGDVIAVGRTKIAVKVEGRVVSNNRPMPEAIPGFKLHEMLGRGSMGVVYRATKQESGEKVAVKIMTPRTDSTEVLRLFIREAGILNQLSHPNIIRFKQFGIHGDHLFLVTQLLNTVQFEEVVEGRSTASRIRRGCRIARRVLRALEFAHQRGLVHRDVKPANVLLQTKDDRVVAKLADFGLAKSFETAGLSGITSHGQLRGTPAFMAPEQVYDCRASLPTVDVYGMAATLYHWLTGESPIEFVGGRNCFVDILERPIVPIRHRLPDVPENLAATIEAALHKDPRQRIQTAGRFADLLRPFANR